MKLVMTSHTEDHGFSATLDHQAFPSRFSLEVPQFSHVVDFHPSLLAPTPFAFLCEKASAQFRSGLVHHACWFAVRMVVIDHSLF